MKALLNLDHISVRRQKSDILRNVSLTLSPHDFITIIGPNGAGKSTLLKAAMGLIDINSGAISHADNIKIGYVPQKFTPDNTVPINVEGFLKLANDIDRQSWHSVITETQTESLLAKTLHTLSGGEMQRVLLARALFGNPNVLVLDEPAQNLDIMGQIAFYKLLDEIYYKRKLSVLMVSHDLHMVMASTNQVVCLFHHICCSGTPQMVAKDPEFINLFGEDMANMVAVYHHEHDHEHDHIHTKDCNHV